MAFKPPVDPLIAIIGATGTGKSKLAIELAKRFDGEIINGDAMQMYEGLPIITNKIRRDEMEGIPHHLLDCVNLADEPWRVSTFVKESQKVIREIRSKGRRPILVGGTHYYTQALVFNESLVEPEEEQESRTKENQTQHEEDWSILEAAPEEMLARLHEVDPEMAKRWHPNDGRKIRRSLEIWLQSGRKASEIYERQKRLAFDSRNGDRDPDHAHALSTRDPTLVFWLYAQSEVLKRRLDTRVDDMVVAGLLEEAQQLYRYLCSVDEKGVIIDRTRGIWVSIGFKELEEYLKNLESKVYSRKEEIGALRDGIDAIKAHTRQYAIKQERWIRRKFLRAMNEAGSARTVFLLDGSNLSKWSEHVQAIAEETTAAFLAGKDYPDPKSISDVAKQVLTKIESDISLLANPTRLQTQCCEICCKTLVGEEQWQNHLVSRGHKNTVKARGKKTGSLITLTSAIETV